jgi:hypothetical protein
MKPHPNELSIPPMAAAEPDAVEFIRAWNVGDDMHVSLNYAAWKRPEMWGIALADIVQHFANACEKGQGWPRQDIVRMVTEALGAELDNPTDRPKGNFT